jgi:hypothetical protein
MVTFYFDTHGGHDQLRRDVNGLFCPLVIVDRSHLLSERMRYWVLLGAVADVQRRQRLSDEFLGSPVRGQMRPDLLRSVRRGRRGRVR